VLLQVAADPGHGGHFSEYRIDTNKNACVVMLTVSKPFTESGLKPAPLKPPSQIVSTIAERDDFKPSRLTEILVKNDQEVEAFLTKLSAEFQVCELADLKSPYPFLHPTFYSFNFIDRDGVHHSFEYQIECSNHLDKRYERMIQEFNFFFESERVFNKFWATAA
jgi:hypothetical protein